MGKSRKIDRERVEPGIYRRQLADGATVFDLVWRDVDGKQHFEVVRDSRITIARSRLREKLSARDRREKVASNPKLRFEDAADQWLESIEAQLAAGTTSRSTVATHKSALKHLRQHFGGRRLLADIDVDDVARYVAAQRTVKRGTRKDADGAEREIVGFRAWSIRGQLSTLSSIFRFAQRRLKFPGQNPVRQLDAHEKPKIQGDQRAYRVLTSDELSRLLGAVDAPYALLFATAAETGLRLGEVLGLTWADVDTDAATLRVSAQLVRGGQRDRLKTSGSARTIEISRDLAARLAEAKLAASDSTAHALVFTSRAGSGHDARNMGRVLARAVKRAGLQAVERDGVIVQRAPSFHDLRHTHASWLVKLGWDVVDVSRRLGHANARVTLSTYSHEFEAAARTEDRRSRLPVVTVAQPPEPGEVVSLDSKRQAG